MKDLEKNVVTMEKNVSIKKVRCLYPEFKSRLYIFFRNLILPVDKIEKYIPPRGKIIDLGCGCGFYTIYFALKNPNRNLLGYELNSKRVDEAKNASKHIKNVTFEMRDLKNTKFTSCDAVCLIDVLHHLSKDIQISLLQESYKRLKPNGILIIKDVDKTPFWKYWISILHDKIMTFKDKLYFSKKEDTNQITNSLGFKTIDGPKCLKTNFLNPYSHYILIVKKGDNKHVE